MQRRITLIAVGLLLLAMLRMASLVLAEPVLGYANQYDMHRTSACVGLWPESVAPGVATPQAPQAIYVRRSGYASDCYPGSQVAIVGLAMLADSVWDTLRSVDNDQVSLRWIGLCGLLIWGAVLLWIGWLFRRQPIALLVHAITALLLIADPFNTLYLNTLYTEFPALVSAYAAAAIVLSLWLDPERTRRRLIALSVLLCVLGLSRVQHLALPFLFALLATLALWRVGKPWLRAGVGLLLLCAGVVAIQATQQDRFVGIARANITDTVFGAAMPAGDPSRIAEGLGLPAHCADLAYSTWYRQHGRDVFSDCPELLSASRLRLLWVSLRQPSVLARMLLRGVLMSQNFRLGYLGERADGDFAAISQKDALAFASLAAPINRLAPAWLLITASTALVLAAGFWVLLLWRRRQFLQSVCTDSMLVICAAHIFLLVLLSSVFGDGYSEVGRHLHLGLNALLVMAAGIPIWCLCRLYLRAEPAGSALSWTYAGISLCVVLLMSGCLLRLPLAFGVLEAPEAAPQHSGMIEVRGWALDRAPLQRVSVAVDGRKLIDLTPVLHSRLAQVFPYLSTQDEGGFSGLIDADQLVGARFLEIIAIDARGQSVMIERRRLHQP